MIPENIPPNAAPGGIVAIAFDLSDSEVTRSVVTPDDIGRVDFLATDAGEAVNERGGGSMAAYDGDSGQRLFVGPRIVIGIDGYREPITHRFEDLRICPQIVKGSGPFPWRVIGVFGTPDTIPEGDIGSEWWHSFCYTVGLPTEFEVWAPCASIEGRYAEHTLITATLNPIAAAMVMGVVLPGDNVIVPLGIPNADDADSVWWVGLVEKRDDRLQAHMTDHDYVVPIRWSSPLGWAE